MSSICRCTISRSRDTEARIKGVASWLLWIIEFKTESIWTFMVNDE